MAWHAIKALFSSGVANPEDSSMQAEILKPHPEGPVLMDSDLPDLSPGISVPDHLVLKALKAFPKGSSPGSFQLRAQHLLDVVFGFTAPLAQDCLHQLTCLINFLLSCSSLALWGTNLLHYIRKMEVFIPLQCVKPYGVWSVVSVASLSMTIYPTCFYHMGRFELESKAG